MSEKIESRVAICREIKRLDAKASSLYASADRMRDKAAKMVADANEMKARTNGLWKRWAKVCPKCGGETEVVSIGV